MAKCRIPHHPCEAVSRGYGIHHHHGEVGHGGGYHGGHCCGHHIRKHGKGIAHGRKLKNLCHKGGKGVVIKGHHGHGCEHRGHGGGHHDCGVCQRGQHGRGVCQRGHRGPHGCAWAHHGHGVCQRGHGGPHGKGDCQRVVIVQHTSPDEPGTSAQTEEEPGTSEQILEVAP